MLIYRCKTFSKLGHFPKIANLFNQNARGQGVGSHDVDSHDVTTKH